MELTDTIRTEPVRHLPPSQPLVVQGDTSLKAVLTQMQSAKKGCVLIEKDGLLEGIATERDILVKFIGQNLPDDTRVSEIMSTHLRTLQLEDTLETAIQMMVEGGYRHVPLTDREGRIQGLVSARHLIEYLSDHFPGEVVNLPPRPDQISVTPEGA
jgi:CBS domain-containing protein